MPDPGAAMEPDGLHVVCALSLAANRLMSARSVHETFEIIVSTAPGSVPGVDQASVSVISLDGFAETVAASAESARLADAARYGGGPWPWSDQEQPVGAWMAMPLHNTRRASTVLNLYGTSARCFDPGARRAAQLFSSYARMGLAKATSEHDLHRAMISRKEIGTAIGIVMERYQLTEDRAFKYLVRLSRCSNVKLREVARQLVNETQAASERREPLNA